MSTYRERREAKAERLDEWASKREAKAEAEGTAALDKARMIPFGQPILVGHHSEKRDRNFRKGIERGFERAAENADKARDMKRRADGIRDQLDRSIYDDDADAIEKLSERIAALEAERDRIKAFNVTARKGEPDYNLLTPELVAQLASITNHAPYQLSKGGGFPGYALSNLGGNIGRNRKRLAKLEQEHAQRERVRQALEEEKS